MKNKNLEIIHLGHAGLYISYEDFSLVIDPWLIGPAFMGGWWLNREPKKQYLELIQKAQIIFISHNHPDHLHPETLSYLDKNKTIITPAFKSSSSAKMLKSIGFSPKSLDYKDIYQFKNKEIYFSILKSGDFRDDSGLYLNINGFKILLSVDSNYLNSLILPNDIDLLATSFASGASGFPLCFQNYNDSEKSKIILRNKRAALSAVLKLVEAVNPKYYLPYAGFFSEKLLRDNGIKERNFKNSPDDAIQIVTMNRNIIGINPMNNDKMEFDLKNKSLKLSNLKKNLLYDYSQNHFTDYLSQFKKSYIIDEKTISEYFLKSNYQDDLLLFLVTTNDDFIPNNHGYLIDFSDKIQFKKFEISKLEIQYNESSDFSKIFIYVREEVLGQLIINKQPWEDASIGFQMRIKRFPNVYNSKFWYHFTNQYIGSENYRFSSDCGACTFVNQNKIYITNTTFK
jgi:CMP-N-acetylneuraminate monooxygenase